VDSDHVANHGNVVAICDIDDKPSQVENVEVREEVPQDPDF